MYLRTVASTERTRYIGILKSGPGRLVWMALRKKQGTSLGEEGCGGKPVDAQDRFLWLWESFNSREGRTNQKNLTVKRQSTWRIWKILCKKLSVGCCALFRHRKQISTVCFMSHFVSSSQLCELASINLPVLQMSKLRLIKVKQFLCHHRVWS